MPVTANDAEHHRGAITLAARRAAASLRQDADANIRQRYRTFAGALSCRGEQLVFDRVRQTPCTLRWLTPEQQDLASKWQAAAAWLAPLGIGGLALPDEQGTLNGTPFLRYNELPTRTWRHLHGASDATVADHALGLLGILQELEQQPWCFAPLTQDHIRITDDGRILLCDLTLGPTLPSQKQERRVTELLRCVLSDAGRSTRHGAALRARLADAPAQLDALHDALLRCVEPPHVPWLGDTTVLDKSTDALCSGRSVRVLAPPGHGGSRLLHELAHRLSEQGVRWWSLRARPGPYESLRPLVVPELLSAEAHTEASRTFRDLPPGVLLLDRFESFDAPSRRVILSAGVTTLSVVRRGPADFTLAPLQPSDLRSLLHHDAGCLGHVEEDTATALTNLGGGAPKVLFRRLAALRRAGWVRWEAGRVHLNGSPSRFAPRHALAPSICRPTSHDARRYLDAILAVARTQLREGHYGEAASLAAMGAKLAAHVREEAALTSCLECTALSGLLPGRIDLLQQSSALADALREPEISRFAALASAVLAGESSLAAARELSELRRLPDALQRWVPLIAAFSVRAHPVEFGRRLMRLSMSLDPIDDRRSVVLTMMARLRREQGQLAEASELLRHAAALPGLRRHGRIALMVRRAFLLLERGLTVDRHETANWVHDAAQLRHPRLEALARLLHARAAYACGEAAELGPELLRSVCVLGEPDLEAAALIHEGAACWREGNALRARLCVLAAEARAERAHRPDMVALAGALWFLASESPDDDRRRRVRLALRHPLRAEVVAEVSAMLVLAGQPLDEAEAARLEASLSHVPIAARWHHVLSDAQLRQAAATVAQGRPVHVSPSHRNTADARDLPATS